MLPSMLLLPLLAFSLTTATIPKNKEPEMTEQAAISANMLREQTLAKRSPSPQAPPPAPGQPAPPGAGLGLDFLMKPNMIVPQGVTMLFSPPPPPAGQDEKRKRSLRKRRERSRPKVHHQKSKSLGGTSLVHDGENVQRSAVNNAVDS
ncbi:hypothetical protein K501DRAFT_312833 [Backusella circina FSU 941]|nr:hypothetical protein K501DRAFT_312833 [Backusella circina FSU 941]